jgi:hypothetical protein
VHHLGAKDGEDGRGATAVKGAMATELLVRRRGGGVEITCTKQKDGPDGGRLALKMTPVTLSSVDDMGISALSGESVVLTPWLGMGEDLSRAQHRLVEIFATTFAAGRGGTKAEIKGECVKGGMSKTDFYRVWNDLMDRGCFAQVRGTQSYRWVPVEEREGYVAS